MILLVYSNDIIVFELFHYTYVCHDNGSNEHFRGLSLSFGNFGEKGTKCHIITRGQKVKLSDVTAWPHMSGGPRYIKENRGRDEEEKGDGTGKLNKRTKHQRSCPTMLHWCTWLDRTGLSGQNVKKNVSLLYFIWWLSFFRNVAFILGGLKYKCMLKHC